jgi:hypothetical protein
VLQYDAFVTTRSTVEGDYLYHVAQPASDALKLAVQSPGAPPRPLELACEDHATPATEGQPRLPVRRGIVSFARKSRRVRRVVRVGDLAIWKARVVRFNPKTSTRCSTKSVKGASAAHPRRAG